MSLVILVHLLVAAGIGAARGRGGRRLLALATAGPLVALVWALTASGTDTYSWVPALNLEFVFRADGWTTLLALVVAVAATAILGYTASYMRPSAKTSSFVATMVVFTAAMLGLVTSDHVFGLFVFWEITTVTSYLLVGHVHADQAARDGARRALLVTGAGGLALLAGLVLLAAETGSPLISQMRTAVVDGTSLAPGLLLVLIGAATKSAQVPFHGWLPGAMAAPTPASALLHSATMVKAGIVLVGALGPLAAQWAPWQPTLFAIGITTMVVGSWNALRQHDLKLLLAHGTVSQLGFMFLLVGSGDPALVFGGISVLVAHALFKAALFMVVGAIDSTAGTRDIRRLSGLASSMRPTSIAAMLAAASMAALPFTLGFAAKEAAFDALAGAGPGYVAAAALASVLTVAYTGRFLLGAFGGSRPMESDLTPRIDLVWAPGLLAVLGLALGVFPGPVARLVGAATEALSGVAAAGKLVLWPGWVPALAWSTASLITGLALVRRPGILDGTRRIVAPLTRWIPRPDEAIDAVTIGTTRLARRSTSVIQTGSLRLYVATILLAILAPVAIATLAGRVDATIPAFGGVGEVLVAIGTIAAAVGVWRVTQQFASVILLGAVGYGTAALFLALGGTDLALTQILVDTLAVGLFALVLRRLPRQRRRPTRSPVRAVAAVSAAAFVFAVGAVMSAAEPDPRVTNQLVERSLPEAGGRNVVNVVLVDFRSLDTLGEIAVLALVALGAAGLVLPVLRGRRT